MLVPIAPTIARRRGRLRRADTDSCLAWAAMFRLAGFPVHVRPGFLMFMALIVILYGDQFGLWLAACLAGFTLLHELGHAMAARRAGARAEISLDFLAGYASYVPTRELSRAEHAWISFAGPAIQIATSVAVLALLGVNPLDSDSFRESELTLAIWWAGPMIGLLNLIPVLPLDGGNILLNGLDRLLPGRAMRITTWFSIIATAVMAVLLFVTPRYRGFGVFVGFLLITQMQLLFANRPVRSPWDEASSAVRAGKPRRARRLLTAALTQPARDVGSPALRLSDADAAALLDVLPEPLPRGEPRNEYVLANLLLRVGRYEDAAHYAADSYARHPHALGAATVARAAAALGDQATAIGWLRAGASDDAASTGLATVIDGSPELAGIRDHPDVVAIRRSLTSSTHSP
jgi:Zn-dependent protease